MVNGKRKSVRRFLINPHYNHNRTIRQWLGWTIASLPLLHCPFYRPRLDIILVSYSIGRIKIWQDFFSPYLVLLFFGISLLPIIIILLSYFFPFHLSFMPALPSQARLFSLFICKYVKQSKSNVILLVGFFFPWSCGFQGLYVEHICLLLFWLPWLLYDNVLAANMGTSRP